MNKVMIMIYKKQYAIKYRKNHKKETQEYNKKYVQIKRGKLAQKKYRGSKKGKKTKAKVDKKYYQKNKEKLRVINRKRAKRYFQTEKGKLSHQKAIRKSQAKRKKNLQWIQMFKNPFDESIKVDYHHVTDVYVVAIPRELHRLHLGKNHREMCMEIVKQIYQV